MRETPSRKICPTPDEVWGLCNMEQREFVLAVLSAKAVEITKEITRLQLADLWLLSKIRADERTALCRAAGKLGYRMSLQGKVTRPDQEERDNA